MATTTRPLVDNHVRIMTAIAARDGRAYTYALADSLDISIHAVRRALSTLSLRGYLRSHLEESPVGPARRVFTLSAAGTRAIA